MTQHEKEIMGAIQIEAATATERYGNFKSTHEALGVLCEEWDELRDAVHSNCIGSVQREAIQVAAVAYRLAVICERTLLGDSDTFKARSGA